MFTNGALLYVVHVCMRGEDDLVEGELYKGTAKSAEGYAADEAFGMAKDDGMHVEVQWQDADSSSSASFRKHYPDNMYHALCWSCWSLPHEGTYKIIAKEKLLPNGT